MSAATDPYSIETISGVGDLTVDAWGKSKSSADHSIFHSLFTFDIPKTMWLSSENGVEVSSWTGATHDAGMASISSNGNNTKLTARRHPRYQPNRGQLWSASMIFPSPDADGVRDFGLFNDENGVFFRLKPVDGVGTLHAVLFRAGVEVLEEAITIPFDIDFAMGNIYDIQMQWRGVGNIKFFVGNPSSGVSQLVHTFRLLNTLSTLSTEDATMACSFKSTRTTADVIQKCGCVDVTSEGGGINREQYGSAYSENVSINGTNLPVIVVRQPDQINSKENTRDIRLSRISVKSSKKGTFKVWTTRDASTITGATYKKVNGNTGSFVETDSSDMDATAVRATSVNVTNMRFITSIPVEATIRTEVTNPNPETVEFFLIHGDYLVITSTFSAATCEAVIEWGEEI